MAALDQPTYTVTITHTNGSEYEEECSDEESSECIDFEFKIKFIDLNDVPMLTVNFTVNNSECIKDIKTMREDLYEKNHSVQFDGLNGNFCMSVTKTGISFSGSKAGGDAPWSFRTGSYPLNSEIEKMLDYMIIVMSK